MEYIEIDKKIFLQVFRYEDIEALSKYVNDLKKQIILQLKKYGIWVLKCFFFISVF